MVKLRNMIADSLNGNFIGVTNLAEIDGVSTSNLAEIVEIPCTGLLLLISEAARLTRYTVDL